MPSGMNIAIIGMGIVFSGLLFLGVAIFLMPRIGRWLYSIRRYMHLSARHRERANRKYEERKQRPHTILDGEVISAISTALYLHFLEHEEESQMILTIQKLTKPFSPWVNTGKVKLIQGNSSVYNRRGK